VISRRIATSVSNSVYAECGDLDNPARRFEIENAILGLRRGDRFLRPVGLMLPRTRSRRSALNSWCRWISLECVVPTSLYIKYLDVKKNLPEATIKIT
jgi:hypothetical protein